MLEIFNLSITPSFIAYSFLALIGFVNPMGSAGFFLSSTINDSSKVRKAKARTIAAYGLAYMVMIILCGNYILAFFDLQLAYVEIGGGFVLGYAAWNMLTGNTGKQDVSGAKQSNNLFIPLTFPITVGPGVTAVLISLSARATQLANNKTLEMLLGQIYIIIASLICMILVAVFYSSADLARQKIGEKFTEVIVKLLAFFIFCACAEMISHGIISVIQTAK